MEKIDISSLELYELENYLKCEPKFRSKQIYEWLNNKLVEDFDKMTNISNNLKIFLNDKFFINKMEILEKITSKEDSTTKYLFKINGNNIIESVLMKYSFGNSVCVSTQSGCRMGCKFCASALNGLSRNLTAGEILGQVYKIQNDINERISNIVLMGSGEPLDNYENVLKFIKIINSKEGLNLGERHITLSTCGLTDKIHSLKNEKLQITLAVSLHAPNNDLRKEIMPIANKYDFDELLEACKIYANETKRRVTFEYALINNFNDKEEHAVMLSKKLRGMMCHVNLIPINDVEERNYKKSSIKNIEKFSDTLKKSGIETTIRRKLGSDINASCGQLRNKRIKV